MTRQAGYGRPMRAARPSLTVVALALVLVLGACDDSSSDDAGASTSSTAPPVTAGPVAASALVPGDCVTGLVLGIEQRIEIDSASVVRCDQPHDVEVFAVFDLQPADLDLAAGDGSYPGRRRIIEAAEDGCDSQLERLGDVAESVGLISVWPTAESWTQGDRAVACAAYSITGSPIEDEILGR